MASGDSFVNIGYYFARGDNTVGHIVAETTAIIWNVLKDIYMPIPDIAQWKKISERFRLLWNLPNCMGALDGKHCRVEKFPNSGSSNFNYKSFHSIVLMACCDADGLFTLIECGYAGRNSDGGIFRASAIKQWLENAANIPRPSRLPNDDKEFPYYFVGDEAFPLLRYLMRPYPKRTLNNTKRVFNYRLSRGRKTIECAFGMMAEKFAVLDRPIRCRDPQKVTNIVKSACILHNYVRSREGIQYQPKQFETTDFTPESIPAPQNVQVTPLSSAYNLRDYLANYFITPHAALPWQWNHIL